MRAILACLLIVWITSTVDAGMRDEDDPDRRPGCSQVLP